MDRLPLPATIADITPAWLNAVLDSAVIGIRAFDLLDPRTNVRSSANR